MDHGGMQLATDYKLILTLLGDANHSPLAQLLSNYPTLTHFPGHCHIDSLTVEFVKNPSKGKTGKERIHSTKRITKLTSLLD